MKYPKHTRSSGEFIGVQQHKNKNNISNAHSYNSSYAIKFTSYKQIYYFNVQTKQMYSQFNIASRFEFRSCSESEKTAGVKHSFMLQAILQKKKKSSLSHVKGTTYNLKLSVCFIQNITQPSDPLDIFNNSCLDVSVLLRTSKNKDNRNYSI